MATRTERAIAQAQNQIAKIQASLSGVGYLCSGTLSKRMMKCGKPNCRCTKDPDARHGPYYEWGRMVGGKLVHRMVPPEQAAMLQIAIKNYRKVKKLMLAWEAETERLIALELPRKP